MYRMILVPCWISCPANSPCPAMRDGPTRTRIFTRGCLLVDAEVLLVLSLLDNAAPNIHDLESYWHNQRKRRRYARVITPQGDYHAANHARAGDDCHRDGKVSLCLLSRRGL